MQPKPIKPNHVNAVVSDSLLARFMRVVKKFKSTKSEVLRTAMEDLCDKHLDKR